MPGWSEILTEIKNSQTSSADVTRHKYLNKIYKLTGRNTIAYYSGWLEKNPRTDGFDINDSDMIGFMNAVKGLDCSQGLDLILHTPGGSPVAAESIVSYLRKKFNNDIRVIVPHLAMSAGTMIACSSKEIIMGKQSSLGPIDPQFGGVPAFNIKDEFDRAKKELAKKPENATYWSLIFRQYPAAFLKTALDAIDLSDKLVTEWLGTCMFDASIDQSKISQIVNSLNEHDNSKSHGRHFNMDKCKEMGLKIFQLEDDPKLQDVVLSIHHAFSISLNITKAIKIIENHRGKAYISTING